MLAIKKMLDIVDHLQEKALTNLADLPPQQEPYINRELSWLKFNERVLEEARDSDNPLFERLNFLSITCSNLDEFFMVRVGSLHEVREAQPTKRDQAKLTAAEQLDAIMAEIKSFNKKQYSTYNRQLIPALAKAGIKILTADELSDSDLAYLSDFFSDEVFPVLTPLAVDAGRPFPLVANHSINLYVSFEANEEVVGYGDFPPFALIQLPQMLPRLIRLNGKSDRFILLEDVISLFLDRLFPNLQVQETICFRISRNADFELEEDEIDDLLVEIEDKIRERQRGEVIRLEIQKHASTEVVDLLKSLLAVEKKAIIRIRGPLDLRFVANIPRQIKQKTLSEWRFEEFSPQLAPEFLPALTDKDIDSYLKVIREQDVLLHHPYQSFEPVVEIIKRAAVDPQVLAIKQTLYRVSGNSPIISALEEAARQGKQVLVLVELKARFDEKNNIHWARRLDRAGCHVIYGIKGLKTHSKITLIVRKEEMGIRRYVHLGTGNYNDQTAKLYTDFGLWTADEQVGRDATQFFNMITGYAKPMKWEKLVPAPHLLKQHILQSIKNEIEQVANGKPGYIIAKMNSLVDAEVIAKLYEASKAGVKICLIVRGVCCLRPGVKGLSENITVRSLVGRFLEHSRIFYYHNGGDHKVYLSSADWMPRNLQRRIELLFPVVDEKCAQILLNTLRYELADTERARVLLASGDYERVDRRGRTKLDSQLKLCQEAKKRAREARE